MFSQVCVRSLWVLQSQVLSQVTGTRSFPRGYSSHAWGVTQSLAATVLWGTPQPGQDGVPQPGQDGVRPGQDRVPPDQIRIGYP